VAGEGLVQRVSARELGLLLFRRFAADGGSLDHVPACGALSAADKRVVGVALLTLVPFYNFHAIKFNANTAKSPAEQAARDSKR
jgi:hypothetical protein